MGWTRNFANLIRSRALLDEGANLSGNSGFSLSDNTPWNVRAPGGNLYSITNPLLQYSQNANPAFFSITGASQITANYLCCMNKNIPAAQTSSTSEKLTTNAKYIFVYFGKDDTAESYEDYKLDSILPCQSSDTSNRVEGTFRNNNNGTFTVTWRINIVPAESGTIKELALFKPMQTYYISSTGYQVVPMIYRNVLDEPIEVTSGVPFSITISVTTPKITISDVE